MQEFRTVREQTIDHLSTTGGNELDLTCNITHSKQLELVLESEAHSMLGSRYIQERTERMLRLTCGFQAQHRRDLVEIAKANKAEGEL